MIRFFLADVKFFLKNKRRLKAFIPQIFISEKKNLEFLTYIFCSDLYLLNINQEFLKHDYYTDVVSFDLSNSSEYVIGEIYISIDRVKENAEILEKAFEEELHRIMFHGALHFCGYSDKKKKEKLNMKMQEDKYLSLF